MDIKLETARVQAAFVNAGLCDYERAHEKLSSAQLVVHLMEQSNTIAGQAAALTAIVTASRCFLGGVSFVGDVSAPLIVPFPLGVKTLGEAAILLGAVLTPVAPTAKVVLIGSGECVKDVWAVRAFWDGWTAGVMPGNINCRTGRNDCCLTGIAAGALAVGQAFSAEQKDPLAGKRTQALSLWSPDSSDKETSALDPEMEEVNLPTALWLIGLGNLGQAFLWALSSLPYEKPEHLTLFLQDDDIIKSENWGTSVLVQKNCYGSLKTKVAENWALARGYKARRIDRKLDTDLRRMEQEPPIALAGLDRMPPRRLLGRPGFEYVIDAGLGATAKNYRDFRVNVFDRRQDPAAHFAGVEDNTNEVIADLMQLPAYKELAAKSGDGGCGAADLAGKSVAVPFVSAFVGALAITQAIRVASGQAVHQTIRGKLGDLKTVRAVLGEEPERLVVGAVDPQIVAA